MSSLSVQQILDAKEDVAVEVPVPEWGGSVYVRKISALDSLKLFVTLRTQEGDELAQGEQRLVHALTAYLCDEAGNPLVTPEQARQIVRKSAGPVNRIVAAGHRFNAVMDSDVDAHVKKSAPSPADTSL